MAAALACASCSGSGSDEPQLRTYAGSDDAIVYCGRVDRTAANPRLWASGAHFDFGFSGTRCEIAIADEQLYGTNYNYLEVIVDDNASRRIRTLGRNNLLVLGTLPPGEARPDTACVIELGLTLDDGPHTVSVVRDTETGMGYTETQWVRAAQLTAPPQRRRVIEYIGDSMTCGAEAYMDSVQCGQGTWFDRHMAYNAYGPTASRLLGYDWMLTSVSGIGLIHSCCEMTITMPQVFGKVALSTDRIDWNFEVQPDIVCICLGQNDGIQDEDLFVTAYIDFVKQLRGHYPEARIVCLSSPMADEQLTAFMQHAITRALLGLHDEGETNVSSYFFARAYNQGCGGHPDIADHGAIGRELADYLSGLTD